MFWIPCLLVVASCVGRPDPFLPHVEYEWARSVLLGAEVGTERKAVVRWREPVRYLVVAAPSQVRHAINDAFAQLRQVLSGVHELSLEHVRQDDARLGQSGFVTVFAIAPRYARAVARRYGAHQPSQGADGWFTIVWNARYELTRAIVFVDPHLEPALLRHTALEEMFQTLGPSNDSALLEDSLLFEAPQRTGSRERLARVDQQVLNLLYRELRAGDGIAAIQRAMRRAWVFGAS